MSNSDQSAPTTPPSRPAVVPESVQAESITGGVAISLRGLTKAFDQHVVVRDLNLEVPTGSFFGMVGPNGAGKTTTLSMATGLLRPTAGLAIVLGHDVWREPTVVKAQMGVLADGLVTFDRLTGSELLHYTGLLHSLPADEVDLRAKDLLAALDLTDARDKIVADYSSGMKKKIGLASALIHAPRLLVLDEPLESVDPISGQVIRDILRSYVASGGTVVLSSHVMELVEGLCDHVAIIHEGKVRVAGRVDEVRQGRTLTERFIELVGGTQLAEGSLQWLRSSAG